MAVRIEEAPFTVYHRIRGYQAVFQRCGGGYDFKSGTRFKKVQDSPVFSQGGRTLTVLVRVKGGTACERQNRPCMRVHYNAQGPLGVHLFHAPVQGLFKRLLNVDIQRQLQHIAPLRRFVRNQTGGQQTALIIFTRLNHSALAAQVLVKR